MSDFLSNLLSSLGPANSLFAGIDQSSFNSSLPLYAVLPESNQSTQANIQFSQEVPPLNTLFRPSNPGGGANNIIPSQSPVTHGYKGNNPVKINNSQVLREGGFSIDIRPAQTEKKYGQKEQIIGIDGSINDVKATKSHEQMKSDEVTDLLPVDSYVASVRKTQKISKDSVKDISFGFPVVEYLEGEVTDNPKEILFADLFKKKHHTPAELVQLVKKKFPVTDRKNDPFADITKIENRSARLPYLGAIIGVAEANKAEESVDLFKMGGRVKKVKKYGPGGDSDPSFGLASAATDLFKFVTNTVTNAIAAKKANKQALSNQSRIDSAADANIEDIDNASALAALATLAQDNSFSFLDLSQARQEGNEGFDESIANIRNTADTQQGRIFGAFHNLSTNLFNNTSSFGRGVAAANSLLPNTLRASSDVAARSDADISNLLIQRGQFNSGLSRELAFDRQAGENYQTQFGNSQISNLGDIATNRSNQLINNRVNRTNATLVNSGANTAAQQQFLANQNQITTNALDNAGYLYNSIIGARNQGVSAQTTNNAPPIIPGINPNTPPPFQNPFYPSRGQPYTP